MDFKFLGALRRGDGDGEIERRWVCRLYRVSSIIYMQLIFKDLK